MDKRNLLTEQDIEAVYDILVRHVGAPDAPGASFNTREQFSAHTRHGHHRFLFGGDLLDWQGWVVLKEDGRIFVPEFEGMSSRQERCIREANAQLGILKENLFPRKGV